MLRDDDSVALIDFGISQSVQITNVLTETPAEIAGTPYYMSPEQASGPPRTSARTCTRSA